jgi:hypothetical protein
MKEPHIEEVANHDDPESCVGVRKGAGEALIGARAGWVLSREFTYFGAPTVLPDPEGNTHGCEIASARVALRGLRPHARAGTGEKPSGLAPTVASRSVPSKTISQGVHSQSRRAATAAWSGVAGRQDRPASRG